MKIRLLLSGLLVALLALPATRAADPKERHTDLEIQMEKMNGAWRKLRARGQLDDPANNAASLAAVATIRQAAEASLTLTPALAEKKPAADRAKFIADYQAGLKTFLVELGKFETALKAGRNDDAKKLLASLGQMQREGHQQFQPPRPPRGSQPPAKKN